MRSTEIESKMPRQIEMMPGLHAERTHKLPHSHYVQTKGKMLINGIVFVSMRGLSLMLAAYFGAPRVCGACDL